MAGDRVAAVVAMSASDGPGCAILAMVVQHVTPAVRPDDVLSGLRATADLAPPVPAEVTRLAQGPLDPATGQKKWSVSVSSQAARRGLTHLAVTDHDRIDGALAARAAAPAGLTVIVGEEVRSRPYAEATQRVVDEEVATLLRQAEQRATRMLGEHRDALDRLTELLLERETVDGTDVDEVLGRIPGQRQPIGATGHATTAVPTPSASGPRPPEPAPGFGPPEGERSGPKTGVPGVVHSPRDAADASDA